jgi:hypothetical protein
VGKNAEVVKGKAGDTFNDHHIYKVLRKAERKRRYSSD